MPRIDFFNFFRYALGTIATIYASVVTLQSLYGWWIYLAGQTRYVSLIRRYVVLHGLRLRFKSFWGDVLVCILLCIVFVQLMRAHQLVEQAADVTPTHAHRSTPATVR